MPFIEVVQFYALITQTMYHFVQVFLLNFVSTQSTIGEGQLNLIISSMVLSEMWTEKKLVCTYHLVYFLWKRIKSLFYLANVVGQSCYALTFFYFYNFMPRLRLSFCEVFKTWTQLCCENYCTSHGLGWNDARCENSFPCFIHILLLSFLFLTSLAHSSLQFTSRRWQWRRVRENWWNGLKELCEALSNLFQFNDPLWYEKPRYFLHRHNLASSLFTLIDAPRFPF